MYENYSTKDDESNQGLILHACGNKPSGTVDADCSLIFGDYYFAVAVAKLSNSTINYWR